MEKYDTQKDWEVDLRHILSTIMKRLWLIILCGVLLGVIALGYAIFALTPTYASSVMFYVNNQQENSDGFISSQVTAAQELARTYMVILETRSVLENAQSKANELAVQTEAETGIKAVNMHYTHSQLKRMVTAEAVDATDVFVVTVTAVNPYEAYHLAQALEEVLPDFINEKVEGSRLRMMDAAVLNTNRVGPNYNRYALLGVLLGVLICLMIVVIADIADTTIHSEEFLSTTYEDVPLLAVIPPSDDKDPRYGGYATSRQGKAQGGAK